jgi:hypothetical protein
MLLGNKTDMPESQWEVKKEEAQQFANEHSKTSLYKIF